MAIFRLICIRKDKCHPQLSDAVSCVLHGLTTHTAMSAHAGVGQGHGQVQKQDKTRENGEEDRREA
jgi:hypothetical protein